MVDVEYATDDPYTLAEMLRAITTTVWYDNMVPAGNTAAMQRNLQRRYTGYLIDMVVSPTQGMVPMEAVSLARLNLTRLGLQIDQAYAQRGLSDEANAHLLE